MKSNFRKHLIREMEKSSSISEFDTAETFLVMYDTGVLKALVKDNGEPFFVYNENATPTQIDNAYKKRDQLHNAPNDIWNLYVHGSAC